METGRIVKTFLSRSGRSVTVRYPTINDVDALTSYINALSQEDTFIEIHNEVVTREKEVVYLEEMLGKIEKKQAIQLLAYSDEVLIGNCVVERGKYRKPHSGVLGISIASSVRQEGIGTILLETLIGEVKTKLGLTLVTLSCYANNPRALHVYEKLGFQIVGTIPGAIAFHGEFVGEVMLYKTL